MYRRILRYFCLYFVKRHVDGFSKRTTGKSLQIIQYLLKCHTIKLKAIVLFV